LIENLERTKGHLAKGSDQRYETDERNGRLLLIVFGPAVPGTKQDAQPETDGDQRPEDNGATK
jgi:hypothetical protein